MFYRIKDEYNEITLARKNDMILLLGDTQFGVRLLEMELESLVVPAANAAISKSLTNNLKNIWA